MGVRMENNSFNFHGKGLDIEGGNANNLGEGERLVPMPVSGI